MDSPFVSIVSNEGVWCMIENSDKLESYRKRARVWVYVFGDSMLLPKQSDCLSEKYFQDFGNGTGICVRNLHKFSANLLFDNQNGIRNQPVSVYGLRPKSNISKQGQALRSYCFNLRISRLTSNMIDSRSNKVNSNSRDCQCNKTDMEKEAASSVELLSLSSAGMEPSVFSIDSTDVATSSMKHESESFDQIKSIPVVSCSSSFKAISMEKIQVHQEEIQQDLLSGLLRTEKESTKFSNLMGEISTNLAAFLELQTIKNSDLETIKELGSGAYGTVCSGKWNGSDVAIKRIKPSCLTEDSVERDRLVADFWKEAYLLGQLNHPNVVALYGVVTDGAVDNLATVTEYMVNGSLRQVLRRMDRTIDRRKRIILAMDAASGMEYLHQKNIVHFDLKSPNLLVNMRNPQKPVCKICDLGLSRIKKQGYVPGGARGTIPWMAPELLDSQKKMVTEKVDVYSFGIVMWELLTGEEPHVTLRSEEIAPIIKGTLRPQIPSWCDPVWRSLMERCWSSDPECRPAFSEIVKELRAMSAAMNIK